MDANDDKSCFERLESRLAGTGKLDIASIERSVIAMSRVLGDINDARKALAVRRKQVAALRARVAELEKAAKPVTAAKPPSDEFDSCRSTLVRFFGMIAGRRTWVGMGVYDENGYRRGRLIERIGPLPPDIQEMVSEMNLKVEARQVLVRGSRDNYKWTADRWLSRLKRGAGRPPSDVWTEVARSSELLRLAHENLVSRLLEENVRTRKA